MKKMIAFVRNNSFFYNFNLVLFVVTVLFLLLFKRTDGFVFLNSFHTPMLYHFFNNMTFFGDGLFSILLFLGLLFFFNRHKKLALLILIAYILSGVFAQIIKKIIISPRPRVYFEMHHCLFYLDTFSNSLSGFNSFPSGHTASAFALATIFATYFKNRYVCVFSMLFAILVGYSRIYLAQHFLIDVLGGAFVGVLFATLSIFVLEKITLKIAQRKRNTTALSINWGNQFPSSTSTNTQ